MRHRVKKIKFKGGYDANRMLIKKLLINFFTHGRIETTLKKAKSMKPVIERTVEKIKIKSEANKNYLLRQLRRPELIKTAFEDIGPVLSKVKGGYVRLTRLGKRDSDNVEMVRIEWAYPIVLNENKVKDKKLNQKEQSKKELNSRK